MLKFTIASPLLRRLILWVFGEDLSGGLGMGGLVLGFLARIFSDEFL